MAKQLDVLALLVDGAIASFQWGLRRKRSRETRSKAAMDRFLRPLALAMPGILIVGGFLAYTASSGSFQALSEGAPGGERGIVRIGAKNFTEQLILGEMMAQLIEAHTDLKVERRFNLGGTMICHGALTSGEIDIYAEYTGTALTAILKLPVIADPEQAYETVDHKYRELFGAGWLGPFGFNNTYAITVRKTDAASLHLKTISDLAEISERLSAGFTAEFSERPDGYPGLVKTYGLRFQEVRDLDPAIMYQAIASHEVDVICAFATDGRIAAFKLEPLQDSRGFFPPYQAAPVVRLEVLRAHPEIRKALQMLAGRLDESTMQRLNFEVDENKQQPREVAREFLEGRGLLNPI